MTRYAHEGASYQLTELPGCDQVVVSHGAFVPTHIRGKGIGDRAHKHRLSHIKELGFDYAVCTVDAANVAQIKILTKNGWHKLQEFVSSKTAHTVQLWGVTITRGDTNASYLG